MREALYFEQPDDFCDFVRLQGASGRPASGELFELHRVAHPVLPGDSALILANWNSGIKEDFVGAAHQIKMEWSNRKITTSVAPEPTAVFETIFAKTLVECVDLVPWEEAIATRAGLGPVLFRVDSPGEVATLIRDSLQLGNDRILFGPVESVSGEPATLVRIEKPSFYLVQRCLESGSGIQLYYPESDDLYIRWGWQHPLREWWKRSEQKRSGDWVFFEKANQYIHIQPVIWKDAYDLTDLRLDFQHRELYTEAKATPPRFTVPLCLSRKAGDQSEPELWLLDEAGLIHLENTLRLTDDESLRSWQMAVQKIAGAPRDAVFIRELRSKSKRTRHHDFGGLGFARYRGINDLLLPVNYELQPPLRRDAYRTLFNLEAGFTTILIPEIFINPESSDDHFLIIKIKESAFDSLGSFVDYLVERDAEVLEDLMAQSVFDFKHYLKAPRHPGLTSGQKSEDGNRGKSVVGIEDLKQAELRSQSDDESETPRSLLDQLDHPSLELDESLLGALEKEELRLERELVTSGQSIHLWCDLAVCKNQLGKTADAVICAIEALWLAKGTDREESLFKTLQTLSGSSLETAASSVTTEDPEWMRRAAVFQIALEEAPSHEMDRWISDSSAFLREHDKGLRSKERWLAWGRILSKNQDDRREAQLREEIRNRIADGGLSLEETPSFLRSRIFLDRKIGGSHDENEVAVESAIGNLESLHSVTRKFTSERLRLASQAILARSYSNIGDLARAQNLLEESSGNDDPCAMAWEAMLQIEALQTIDQNRARILSDNLGTILKKANKDTSKAVSDLRETYREKADQDNPAAFLARENRGRTYPRGPGTEKGDLYNLSIKLEEHVTSGNEIEAISAMRSMMTLTNKDEYNDSVKLPQFVETLVAGLERFKWGDRGAGLVPLFEEFSSRAPTYLTHRDNQFYGSILHSNLALGLLVVENIEKAVEQISLAEKLVLEISSELDFVDAAAALVRTVEQLPLTHRRSILTSLFSSFRSHFDVSTSHYLHNEKLFATLVVLIDQFAEAASSKDRLSLQQFRSYQLQDEFLILQRIQTETFLQDKT